MYSHFKKLVRICLRVCDSFMNILFLPYTDYDI